MKGIYLAIIFMCLLGCTFEKKYETQELKKEVMELHDEVMPLMDPLFRIRRNLRKKIESDSDQYSLEKNLEMDLAIQEIQEAEDAMMDWMRNFDPNFEGESDSITFMYFTDKKESIEEVALEMKDALSKGEGINIR